MKAEKAESRSVKKGARSYSLEDGEVTEFNLLCHGCGHKPLLTRLFYTDDDLAGIRFLCQNCGYVEDRPLMEWALDQQREMRPQHKNASRRVRALQNTEEDPDA